MNYFLQYNTVRLITCWNRKGFILLFSINDIQLSAVFLSLSLRAQCSVFRKTNRLHIYFSHTKPYNILQKDELVLLVSSLSTVMSVSVLVVSLLASSILTATTLPRSPDKTMLYMELHGEIIGPTSGGSDLRM